MYRVQVFDATTTAMHWQIHKDAAADWRGMGERMDVAIVLGIDPVTAYTASAPLPKHIDELMLSGFLRGKPVELVRCKTVDLEVPARAEIVIEGYIAKGELRDEGPFGDHTGYYTPREPFPVVHVTAVTTRRDPIYPSIIVGVPPQEDAWLGKTTERLFLPAVRMTMPEVVDYDLPAEGAFHNLCIVAIRKAYPGHARKVMHAIWGTGLLSLTKGVVVVDADVDVHDYAQVMWQVGANVDPARDIVLADGPLDHLDHAPTLQFHGGKLGIDATAKGPADGYERGWPERIRMSDDMRERVTSRWSDYGIELSGAAAGDGPQTGKMRRFARSGRRGG
jgi:4-hydroxy-3-polyprenylbenzoate decarboxylase